MAWYNRNKNNTVVLPELEKYYDAERRERSGLAWILALVSVAGIALVLIGIFFGGRWTYRHFKNDKPATIAVSKPDTAQAPDSSNNSSSTANNTPVASTPAPSATAPTTPAVTPATTPSTQSNDKLVNTGPNSVLPVFIVTTVAGTLVYRRKFKALN